MIDQLGFKGRCFKGVGVYEKQALVLVNHGDGTGAQVLELAEQIRQAVLKRFGVGLGIEPIVV